MRLKLASFNRFQAAGTHLALSALIATTVFLVIFKLWFPDVLFTAAGGAKLFFLIAGVDVTIGPLLTLVVFDPRKKSLRFDLAVIAALQVAALCYGVSVLYEARPAFVAFVRDRFELVRANDVPAEDYAKARDQAYASAPLTGPRLVGVRLPTNPDEVMRLLDSALHGRDAQYFPQYYVPYDQVGAAAAKAGQPIAKLRALNPGRDKEIDDVLASLGRKEGDVAFLPMRAGRLDLAVLVDRHDGTVLKTCALQPWGGPATTAPPGAPPPPGQDDNKR